MSTSVTSVYDIYDVFDQHRADVDSIVHVLDSTDGGTDEAARGTTTSHGDEHMPRIRSFTDLSLEEIDKEFADLH